MPSTGTNVVSSNALSPFLFARALVAGVRAREREPDARVAAGESGSVCMFSMRREPANAATAYCHLCDASSALPDPCNAMRKGTHAQTVAFEGPVMSR